MIVEGEPRLLIGLTLGLGAGVELTAVVRELVGVR
jgi:hypothetical protein